MGISVQKALTLAPLDRARVLAGTGGLGREVAGIGVMEAPDIDVWIKGNEFVLTSAFFTKDSPEALVGLIQTIHGRGAAALGINLERWVKEVPAEALKLANDLDFPVILLPTGVSWLEIMTRVMQEVFSNDGQTLHRRLIQAAISTGMDGIVTELGILLRRPVALLEGDRNLIAFTDPSGRMVREEAHAWLHGHEEGESIWEQVMHSLTPIRLPLAADPSVAVLIAPVRPAQENPGFLIVWEGHTSVSQTDMLALEHGANLLSLELQKRRTVSALEHRYQEEFLMDLLFGRYKSSDELVSRGKLYGLNLSGAKGALTVDLEAPMLKGKLRPDLRERIIAITQWTIKSHPAPCIPVVLQDCLAIILNETINDDPDHLAVSLATSIRAEVQRLLGGVDLTVGIGTLAAEPGQLSRSFDEARQAMSMGRLLWGAGRSICFRDLGVYRLILKDRNSEELLRFKADVLGPMSGNDEPTANLLDTLETYLDCNNSVSLTAAKLYVHNNTVKYRIGRIRNLLKVDLDRNDERFQLMAALKVRRMERQGMLPKAR